MMRSRLTGFCLLLAMLMLLASSCASSRPPYHRYYKPKKPPKCDCSTWVYNNEVSIFYLQNNEERPSGRA